MKIRDLHIKLNVEWCSCRYNMARPAQEAKYITEYMPSRITVCGIDCSKQSTCEAAIVHDKGDEFRKSYELTTELLTTLILLKPLGHDQVKKVLESWGHGRRPTKSRNPVPISEIK